MTFHNSEFALHIHKLLANDQHGDLYTIGIWKGTVLHAVCHIQPLDCALDALRVVLDEAGRPRNEAAILAVCHNLFRRARTVVSSIMANLLRSDR